MSIFVPGDGVDDIVDLLGGWLLDAELCASIGSEASARAKTRNKAILRFCMNDPPEESNPKMLAPEL